MALLISLAAGAAPAREISEGFSETVDDLVPAVVAIATTQTVETGQAAPSLPEDSPFREYFEDFFGRRGGGERQVNALGSGFVIDPDGYVVTNAHVIANADEIRVVLSDDTSYDAELVGADRPTDLALLKVDAPQPLPHVSWGDSDTAEVGDWAIAIGNPFGLGGSVTVGVVSAQARDIRAGLYDDFLQTDAPINRGNSGGPLFNIDGEVIGVNTVILSPGGGNVGIGFAVPTSTARPIVAQLREKGHVDRGWLGVQFQAVDEAIAESVGLDEARGAMVARVVEGSPAARAGLESGDIIISYDGRPVERARDLPNLVAKTDAGTRVPVTVWRDGGEVTVNVEIALREPQRTASSDERPDGTEGAGPLGMELAELTPEVRNRLGLDASAEGAVVVGVQPDGPAAAGGIEPGDVIESIARKPVEGPDDVARGIEAVRESGRKNALMRINRQGNVRYVALPV
ncbi:MAG TPA: DegQ family serine endoprotease [Chromatiales bacterium]|nr:DegQ family serine endoprotease [Chromatiales bacterium]